MDFVLQPPKTINLRSISNKPILDLEETYDLADMKAH